MNRLILALALCLWSGLCLAQSKMCPTRPTGDSTNACASTAFVSGAVSVGANFASPPPLGSVTPNSVAATTLSASGLVSGVGFTSLFASPPSIGNITPNTVASTNLTALGTVLLVTPATSSITNVAPPLGPYGSTFAYDYFSMADNGSVHGNGIHAGLGIFNTVTGSGVFGTANTDMASLIYLGKSNQLTTSVDGELDAVQIAVRQGAKGDAGALVLDANKTKGSGSDSGGVSSLEAVVQWLTQTSGAITQDMHMVIGLNEAAAGVSGGAGYGFFTDSRLNQTYAAYYADTFNQYSGGAGTYGWKSLIVGSHDRSAANEYFRVRGDQVTGVQVPGDIIQGPSGGQTTIRTDASGNWVLRNNGDTITNFFITPLGGVNIPGTLTARNLVGSSASPTITSGFCTSPSISSNNGTWAFTLHIGTSCAGSVGVLALPAATNNWVCDAHDITTPASNVVEESASTTTSVTLQNYVRTTGVAGNFTSGDSILVKCVGG